MVQERREKNKPINEPINELINEQIKQQAIPVKPIRRIQGFKRGNKKGNKTGNKTGNKKETRHRRDTPRQGRPDRMTVLHIACTMETRMRRRIASMDTIPYCNVSVRVPYSIRVASGIRRR